MSEDTIITSVLEDLDSIRRAMQAGHDFDAGEQFARLKQKLTDRRIEIDRNFSATCVFPVATCDCGHAHHCRRQPAPVVLP